MGVGNEMNELKDFGYMFMWSIVAIGFVALVIHHVRENAFQSGYWKGRADGWKLGNRQRDYADNK